MHDHLQRAIDWMEAHDKLAGWAQTFGALVAIVIALALPIWQRRQQLHAEKVQTLKLKFNLINLAGLIAGELYAATNVLIKTPTLSPSQLASELSIYQGLRGRIDSIEPRLPDTEHIDLLFFSRGALMHLERLIAGIEGPAQTFLTNPDIVKILTTQRDYFFYKVKSMSRDADKLDYQLGWIQIRFWRWPQYWYHHRTMRSNWKIEFPKPTMAQD